MTTPIQRYTGVLDTICHYDFAHINPAWEQGPGSLLLTKDAEKVVAVVENERDALAAANLTLAQEIGALREECARLRDAWRWISCSAQEPTRDGRYAILYGRKDGGKLRQFTGDYLINYGWGSVVDDDKVYYWMELPPAPPGQSP